MMETVTLRNGALTVRVAQQGAEIQSILDDSAVERLWQGQPGFWSRHAPVLFPVAGALRDGAYLLNGARYALPKHGFAGGRLFAVEESAADAVTLLLSGDAAAHEGFPFEYAFRARYALEGHTLVAQTIVTNTGGAPLWYGAGAHEAYDCPGGVGAYELVFENDEPLFHSLLDGGLLAGGTVPVETDGRVLRIREELFVNNTLVLAGIASRSVTLRSRLHRRRVRVDFPDFSNLLVWTDPGADFLCVEPWSNLPDAVDSDQDITKKPGMIRVAPGETSTLTHAMTFE